MMKTYIYLIVALLLVACSKGFDSKLKEPSAQASLTPVTPAVEAPETPQTPAPEAPKDLQNVLIEVTNKGTTTRFSHHSGDSFEWSGVFDVDPAGPLAWMRAAAMNSSISIFVQGEEAKLATKIELIEKSSQKALVSGYCTSSTSPSLCNLTLPLPSLKALDCSQTGLGTVNAFKFPTGVYDLRVTYQNQTTKSSLLTLADSKIECIPGFVHLKSTVGGSRLPASENSSVASTSVHYWIYNLVLFLAAGFGLFIGRSLNNRE